VTVLSHPDALALPAVTASIDAHIRSAWVTLDRLPTVRYICIQLELPHFVTAGRLGGSHGNRQTGGPAIRRRQRERKQPHDTNRDPSNHLYLATPRLRDTNRHPSNHPYLATPQGACA
jgi:hypothetical protein